MTKLTSTEEQNNEDKGGPQIAMRMQVGPSASKYPSDHESCNEHLKIEISGVDEKLLSSTLANIGEGSETQFDTYIFTNTSSFQEKIEKGKM